MFSLLYVTSEFYRFLHFWLTKILASIGHFFPQTPLSDYLLISYLPRIWHQNKYSLLTRNNRFDELMLVLIFLSEKRLHKFKILILQKFQQQLPMRSAMLFHSSVDKYNGGFSFETVCCETLNYQPLWYISHPKRFKDRHFKL